MIAVGFFPMKGFLGTGAPFGADLNLAAQLSMGIALIVGALLAKHKCYRAHGICQTTVLLLNLVMIALVMWPSFQQQVKPAMSKVLHKWYYGVATIHAALGIAAELLGLYIVIVAGTEVLPQWLRFKHWKLWMRMELVLWAIVLGSGLGTYCAWYLAPFR
jgi:uncharacterized membrane protein YozB (DUF420 family)